MFAKIIQWSLVNRLFVLFGVVILMVCAVLSFRDLNLDAFPDVTNIQVTVNTQAPGYSAEEVEQLITYPIESVMYSLAQIEQVRSISKTGLSVVTVVFKDSVDINQARQWVFEQLQLAKNDIPTSAGIPSIGPNTSGLGQVFQYLLINEGDNALSNTDLRSLNDYVVKLLLMPIDGVTQVLSFGGEVKQYQVSLNPHKLLAYQLTQQQVVEAIEGNNRHAGGWYLNQGAEQLIIRGAGWFESGSQGIDQIGAVAIKTISGTAVRVSDVADVSLGGEIRQGAVTMSERTSQGEIESYGEVVTGIVLKRMGANTNTTINAIEQRLTLINQALPEGVRLKPFYNQSQLIEQAVTTVVKALLIASVLITLIIALFLLDLGATLLVLISIPISIGTALMLMSWLGLSANLMSLGGLAVAIGLLVDGSVVMVEHLVKRVQHASDNVLLSKAQRMHLIGQAAQEVARPILFATAIILVVFIPIFSFEGVEAKLFKPMAQSIVFAVISAVIVALIVVPALASLMIGNKVDSKKSWLAPITLRYQYWLSIIINRPRVLIASAVVALIGSVWILMSIGTEFVPELEEGTLNLRVTLAPTANLETAVAVSSELETLLLSFDEVDYAVSRIGRAEIGGDPEPVNNIEIYMGLKPHSAWTNAKNREQLSALMKEKLAVFPGLRLTFSQPIATRVDELLSGVKAQLAIKLFGPDLAVLAEQGEQLQRLVAQVDGTTEVELEQIAGEAQLLISPDRDALYQFGLSVSDLMSLIQNGIGGQTVGQVIDGNERSDIIVRLGKSYRDSAENIGQLIIQSPAGAWVRVSDVAKVSYHTGPLQVRRENVQRRVVVQANVQGRDMGNVVKDIQATITGKLHLPAGYYVEIGGQYENQQRAQQRLMWIIPLSLCLIAVLLYFAFHSVGQALLILLNVPFALIGGILSLYLSGQYLSVPSSVGFITLFGVAVLNGVVLVQSINQQVANHASTNEAIIAGAATRLSPVLMTALTSALGLIPMLLSTGVGAEIQKPLASVIIGGLISSTLLTLFVLPSCYGFFSKYTISQLRPD